MEFYSNNPNPRYTHGHSLYQAELLAHSLCSNPIHDAYIYTLKSMGSLTFAMPDTMPYHMLYTMPMSARQLASSVNYRLM